MTLLYIWVTCKMNLICNKMNVICKRINLKCKSCLISIKKKKIQTTINRQTPTNKTRIYSSSFHDSSSGILTRARETRLPNVERIPSSSLKRQSRAKKRKKRKRKVRRFETQKDFPRIDYLLSVSTIRKQKRQRWKSSQPKVLDSQELPWLALIFSVTRETPRERTRSQYLIITARASGFHQSDTEAAFILACGRRRRRRWSRSLSRPEKPLFHHLSEPAFD